MQNIRPNRNKEHSYVRFNFSISFSRDWKVDRSRKKRGAKYVRNNVFFFSEILCVRMQCLDRNIGQFLLHLLFLEFNSSNSHPFQVAHQYVSLFLFLYLLQQIDQLFYALFVMWWGNVRSSVYFVFDKRFFFFFFGFRCGFSTFE